MSDLSKHNYVATDADIRDLTRAYLSAVNETEGTRSTYLRALVATTQKELGANPARKNNSKGAKLDEAGIKEQLEALERVHDRFAPIIAAEIESSLEQVPAKERSAEKNRRGNFARTALYAARTYIRAGRDLTSLAAGKLSKSGMRVPHARKRVALSPRRLKNRVERASKVFVKALLELSEADKDTAVEELETLMGIMAAQLAAVGAPLARSIEQAASEGIPFRKGATVFIPTMTQVLRQTARPS